MAVKIALDTNAYADLKKGTRWIREIAEASEIHFPTIVLGELFYGFACGACGDREQKNVRELKDFLGDPLAKVDVITFEVARQYGHLKQYLRKHGKPIPDNDVWIAASCIENGCTLLTSDKHFDNLPQVRLARGAD